MKRLVLTLVAVLACSGVSLGKNYTLGTGGLYFDDSGAAYTREVQDSGYWYWNGCRYAWYPQTSYSYTRVNLDLAAPDFETQALAIVAARQKAADRRALIDKLGLGANTGGIVNPLGNYGGYGFSRAYQFGSYGVNGNTLYGYSAYADPYGSTDLNTLYQQASSLAKGSQDLTGQATGGFLDLVKQAGGQAALVAQIREQGAAAERALNAAKAAPQTTGTVIEGVGGTGAGATTIQNPLAPAVEPKVMPRVTGNAPSRAQIVRSALCASCHTGANAKGGFAVEKWATYSTDQKLGVLSILTTSDESKRMPRKADGSAGAKPTMDQLKAFLEP